MFFFFFILLLVDKNLKLFLEGNLNYNRNIYKICYVLESIMEEYVNKRNYLNHLKQISAIKNGQYKSGITQSKSRISLLNNNTLR